MKKGGIPHIILSVGFDVVVIAIILYSVYPYFYPETYPYLAEISGRGGEIKYGECRTEGEINSALEDYFRSDFKESRSSNGKEKLFCESVVLWENKISENEKVAYANANCQDIAVVDNDLRRKKSSGFFGLFKVEKQGDAWQVADYDDRISPKQESKDWVKNNLVLLPKTVYGNCNLVLLGRDNLEKIGKEAGVEVPHYSFNYCFNDKNCADGEVCKLRKLFDPYGIQNHCVRKCSSHADCGAGYVCRKQCLYGENGCPRTGVDVCVMDIASCEFDKNEAPF